ncbi:MAG TPA: hypothetical protein VGP77_07100, partial [Vicinamibacterales bacterium]|nr:hypothetical protein [Vicinamibacterales bacterium]
MTEGLDAKTKAVPLRFSLPLESLATGRYDRQVSVIDPVRERTLRTRVLCVGDSYSQRPFPH